MKHTDIIRKLNLEQKCALLSGETVFTTRALPGKGIPSITLSDGPNGVRKQAGAADHLGLNPSVPATCFPTSSATACSWDEALGEAVGEAMGEEAAAQEVAVLLGPGLNIQRSPLCGRDFEYFSEDLRRIAPGEKRYNGVMAPSSSTPIIVKSIPASSESLLHPPPFTHAETNNSVPRHKFCRKGKWTMFPGRSDASIKRW